LEQSIHAAHRALANRIDARPELEERLRQYEAMLMAQRRAADELEDAMKQESWDAVERCIRIINGISTMLRDDAREVVALLTGEEPASPEVELFC
jgi:CHASE3 domain sensor protein